MTLEESLCIELKNKTGLPLRVCMEAVKVFNNLNQAYCLLDIKHAGVCYRKPEKSLWKDEDYINCINKNIKPSDTILGDNKLL